MKSFAHKKGEQRTCQNFWIKKQMEKQWKLLHSLTIYNTLLSGYYPFYNNIVIYSTGLISNTKTGFQMGSLNWCENGVD